MSEHIELIRLKVKPMLNKKVRVYYRRKNTNKHMFVGVVKKINKNSLKLEQEDEDQPLKINIGFRNILKSEDIEIIEPKYYQTT